jgi:FkbH-like protein
VGASSAGQVKCVVWDLDDTLWTGALLEGAPGELRDGVLEVITTLDRRGIVHSVASNGDAALATARLRELGLEKMLLYPQIQLGIDKATAVRRIAGQLGISLRHCALVDDDPFQRAYLAWMAPEVRLYDATDVKSLPSLPELCVDATTTEASTRREMYVAEAERRSEEARFRGSRAEFLASCDMRLEIRAAEAADAPRVTELLARTHRMHASLTQTSAVEIERAIANRGTVYVASLADRFGHHGLVACVLLRPEAGALGIDVFAMSCRVLGRGVGESLLAWVLAEAARRDAGGVRLRYRITRENVGIRLLLASLRFETVELADDVARCEHALTDLPPYPAFLTVAAP